MAQTPNVSGYTPGHPWYYILGGAALGPKKILETVRASGYRGYLADDILLASMRCEPRRSADLRELRRGVLASLRLDLARYREVVRELRQSRRAGEVRECKDVHVSVSLKHNHLYNDLAHLAWIDDLLAEQRDLFDFM